MRFRCVSMNWIHDAHQIRIRYAYTMRIWNSQMMRISEYTHWWRINDTFIHLFRDMRFKCISDAHQKCWNALMRILKRFKCVSCSLGILPPKNKTNLCLISLANFKSLAQVRFLLSSVNQSQVLKEFDLCHQNRIKRYLHQSRRPNESAHHIQKRLHRVSNTSN